MKRSEVNQQIDEAVAFIRGAGITLPHHANWSLEAWYQKWTFSACQFERAQILRGKID